MCSFFLPTINKLKQKKVACLNHLNHFFIFGEKVSPCVIPVPGAGLRNRSCSNIRLDLAVLSVLCYWGQHRLSLCAFRCCRLTDNTVASHSLLWAFFSTLATNQSLSLISKLLPFTLPAEHSFIMDSLSASASLCLLSLPHSLLPLFL